MIREYEKCELCEEPLADAHQTTEMVVKAGIARVHKSCAYQLMLAAWDELVYRTGKNIPVDSPYTSKHIATPAVRKALKLDYSPEDRILQDYAEHGPSTALADMYDTDEDGLIELVEQALGSENIMRKHLEV